MSIGPDIKEVLATVGTGFTWIRADGTAGGGEYLDFENSSLTSQPFIREFFANAYISYDTAVLAGDYIVLAVDGRKFLVASHTPELFENAVIKYDILLYKCNHEVQVMRRDEHTSWDANFDRQQMWETVHTDVPCLLTDAMTGLALASGAGALNLLEMGIANGQMYVPSAYGIRLNDRIVVSADERYLVNRIEDRKFNSVSIASLTEDSRG